MIRHLLFDADHVLQAVPDGQRGVARRLLGARADQLLDQLYAAESASLRGMDDFPATLRRILAEQQVDLDPAVVYDALWRNIEVSAEVIDLVGRLRAGGYGVHLGTNQHRQRAAYLREELGYDRIFDVGCYSCDLAAMKPEPAFFERALRLIGASADQVLFVDDSLTNVEGARAAGLAAEQWDLSRPVTDLERLVAGHGVVGAS